MWKAYRRRSETFFSIAVVPDLNSRVTFWYLDYCKSAFFNFWVIFTHVVKVRSLNCIHESVERHFVFHWDFIVIVCSVLSTFSVDTFAAERTFLQDVTTLVDHCSFLSFHTTGGLHHCTCWWEVLLLHFHPVSLTCSSSPVSVLQSHWITLFSLSVSLCVWRWTTRLWRENRSLRLAAQSSHTTILWRPATSVSFPPTVSRVSRPHLAKIVSKCLIESHLEIINVLLYHPAMSVFGKIPKTFHCSIAHYNIW